MSAYSTDNSFPQDGRLNLSEGNGEGLPDNLESKRSSVEDEANKENVCFHTVPSFYLTIAIRLL